jgi:NOL1/NOP2/fmu family ribosome biogenesis protein
MASKRRLRRKACEGKKKHTREGVEIARGVMKKKGVRMVIYKCRFCRMYHLGHPDKRTKQAIKAKYGDN